MRILLPRHWDSVFQCVDFHVLLFHYEKGSVVIFTLGLFVSGVCFQGRQCDVAEASWIEDLQRRGQRGNVWASGGSAAGSP